MVCHAGAETARSKGNPWMKIALVVHDYHRIGGHSRYVVALAEEFAAKHEVDVFAHTVEAPVTSAIRFHHVRAWRSSALTTILSFPLFAHAEIRAGFDIIHAQGFSTFRPDVITAHICHAAWHEARRAAGNLSLKERLTDAVLTRIERSTYKQSARVIAVSEKVRCELLRFYGRGQNVMVVPHGVDVDEFTPVDSERSRLEIRRKLGLGDGLFTGLYVGDLRKGADVLLQLLNRVRGMTVVCVSRSGPEATEERARALGVEARLIMCPPTTRIKDYYAAADVLLFPTVYDAFGMVISEAMSCGLPVITTRSAGAAELIRNGVDGLIAESPRDVEQITRWLQDLMADPERRHALGVRARKTMETRTWTRVAQETLKIYEDLLEERSR